MCDYSLHQVQSRPARVGDRLVTSEFRNTTTCGLAAVDNANVAVCLLPGTEIAFDNDVKVRGTVFLVFPKKQTVPERVARFRQINVDHPALHHDALEFPCGRVVLLTHVVKGQRATVLQLPAQSKSRAAAPVPERAAFI